jgi:predicted nicotinamide N-methyase
MLTLTDADPNALELCGRNCQHNTLDPSQYSVVPLTWGEKLPVGLLKDAERKFDTVLATDVLYDIGLLHPLFRTAVDCLGNKGTFVLSHVPRACYSSDHPPVNSLEDHIIERAREFGFYLTKLVRPSDLGEEPCRLHDALNADVSLKEMGQVGAAILIFDLR